MDRCLKSTFSRVAPYWLRASSLFLSYFAWTSFRAIPKRCLSNSSAKKLICTKHPQTSECLGQISGFWRTWSLFCDLFWRESKSHGCISLPTSRIANFCFCFQLRFGAWSVSPPPPCGIRRIMSRQWFSLRRYAYLLLPLCAGWAGRPWCWLPDRAGRSEWGQPTPELILWWKQRTSLRWNMKGPSFN